MAYALYVNEATTRPNVTINIAGTDWSVTGPAGLPIGTWSHLAATYDGQRIRLYVDAVEVASQARPGSITPSSGPLRIGGNSVWGEWFEARVRLAAIAIAELARVLPQLSVGERAVVADHVRRLRDDGRRVVPRDRFGGAWGPEGPAGLSRRVLRRRYARRTRRRRRSVPARTARRSATKGDAWSPFGSSAAVSVPLPR